MQKLVLMVWVFRTALAGGLTAGLVFTTPDPDTTKDAHKIYMSESFKGGDKVITLEATDADTPASSLIFTMGTSPVETTDLFEIIEGDLVVKAAVPEGTFDYDKVWGAVREYDITLKVTDGTTDAILQTKIYIQDENDNAPEFLRTTPYEGNVLESTPGDTSVYKMVANDADGSDKNRILTYTISGTTQFVINSYTGVISTSANAAFNIATKSQYQMNVTATDGGDSPKSVDRLLTLMIVTAPKFDNLATNLAVNIDENVPADTSVFTFTVSDKDTPTADLTIFINTQSPSLPRMFKVDGKVLRTINNGLDTEMRRNYTLKFRVTDGLYSTDSASLTVNINDLNDNTPTISPIGLVNIEETKTIGPASRVVDIYGKDDDVTDPNNKLSYSIISGNDQSLFGIISTVEYGFIYFTEVPRSMTVNEHVLKVRVSDGATSSRTATVDITVNINPNIVDECLGDQCQNGAPCTSYVNDYICACVEGYEGKNCETNINSCTETTCSNGGTCIDGRTCNCAPGYTGAACTEVCTNGKYGSGCLQTCNCDASRLIEGVGTQTCNYVTGACKCNSKWTGNDCQTDVNECSSENNCSAIAHKICENTIGGYFCACRTGYIETTDSTCKLRTTTETLTAGANELKIEVRINLDKPCINRDTPSEYAAEKQALEETLKSKLPSVKHALVNNIICDPETFDSVIIIDNTEAAKENFAKELQSIMNGELINVDGVNTKVTSITVDDKIVYVATSSNSATQVCDAYTAYVNCPSGEECKTTDGTASCVKTTDGDDDEDNTNLIIGLTLGLILPLLTSLIIWAICCCLWYKSKLRRKRRRQDKYSRESQTGEYRRTYNYPRSFIGDNGEQPYKRDYYGLPPLEDSPSRY